jgi:hypothetical protein
MQRRICRKLTQGFGAVLLFGLSYVVSAVMNAATISQPALVGPQSNKVVVVIAAPSASGPAHAAYERVPTTPRLEPRYEAIEAQPAAAAPTGATLPV